ncbi:hypothetical protein FACS1894189_3710 [Planctomycetales bacterium]|nr:hypothetical protein FACS1894189_3710 [Planctomycetales bacterium]
MTTDISPEKLNQISQLASIGFTPYEAGIAIGLSKDQIQTFLDDDHSLFTATYWTSRTKYTHILRESAVQLVRDGEDDKVRQKMLEYLLAESEKIHKQSSGERYSNLSTLRKLAVKAVFND